MYAYFLLTLLILYLLRKYFFNSPRTSLIKDMSGQIVVITGASAGIGKETAKALYQQGATVILATRNAQKTNALIEKIRKESEHLEKKPSGELIFLKLDLSDLNSVYEFSQKLKDKFSYVDILINNAGAINEKFSLTVNGIESTFQINHVSPIILTTLVLDMLNKSKSGRIINVASDAHLFVKNMESFFEFDPQTYPFFVSYGWSKLGNILFAFALKNYFEKKNIDSKAVSLHPGAVLTEIARTDNKPWYYKLLITLITPLMLYFFKTEEVGAQTTIHLAYMDYKDLVSGGYYADCKLKKVGKSANNKAYERKIWEVTHRLINESDVYKNIIQEGKNEDFREFIEYLGNLAKNKEE